MSIQPGSFPTWLRSYLEKGTISSKSKYKAQRPALPMLVTIGQINTINGDWEANTSRIIRAIEQGKRTIQI
jgi:hypothetical protein